MIVRFTDRAGEIRYRTLTRLNVRKVAESIQLAHPGHPLSHTVAILERALRHNRDSFEIECDCSLPQQQKEER